MSVNLKDGQIICLAFANGKKHDFRLFKESNAHVLPDIQLEADTGYLGLTGLHTNSSIPKKRSKNYPLTKQGCQENKEISRQRIFVKHAIRFVKGFHILSFRRGIDFLPATRYTCRAKTVPAAYHR